MNRAEIDMRGRVVRVQLQYSLISRDRLGLRIGILFERDALSENPRDIDGDRSRLDQRPGGTSHYFIGGGEVEHELTSDGFNQSAFVAKSDAMAGAEGASLKQWILHSRHLLLHSIERPPDDSRSHLASAQVTNFLDLY